MFCQDNCCKKVTVHIQPQTHQLDFALNVAQPQNIVLDIQKTGGCSHEAYDGDYNVVPSAHREKVLPTQGKVMLHDVSVVKIPYYETSNKQGLTIYIASEV